MQVYLKELDLDTMRSKKINDRNYKTSQPIEVQYSNKDPKNHSLYLAQIALRSQKSGDSSIPIWSA